MSEYNFVSPGAAAGDALEKYLMEQHALRRQAMIDEITKRNTESQIADRAMNRKIQEENLRSMEDQRAGLAAERNTSAADHVVKALSPDQEIDPDTVTTLKKGHYGGLVLAGQQTGGAMDPSQGEGPVITGSTPDKFRGTAAQIKEREDRKRAQDYLASLDPGSPEAKALQYEQATGKTAPEGMFKSSKPETQPVMRVNPRTGKLEQIGDAPTGAHFVNEPPAKDTTQGDNARLDKSYQYNDTALEKLAKPVEDQMGRLRRLQTTVNQGTPQADALIAPELLTIMAGGQGSGLRMNEAEIARIVGGRSNWEGIKAAANKWQLDPNKALSVTPAQRQQIRDLFMAVIKESSRQLDVLDKARTDLIAAPDVGTHRRIVADVHKNLRLSDEATDDPAAQYKVTVR